MKKMSVYLNPFAGHYGFAVKNISKMKHRIEIDGLTVKCVCGWKKTVDYPYQLNQEADQHYDETMPDRLTMNHAPKNSRDRVPVLV